MARRWWLIPLLLAPLIELALMTTVARWISWLPTLGLACATSALGAAMIFRHLALARRRAGVEAHDGRLPIDSLLRDARFFAVGALFLIPGFLSDVMGVVLLIPAARRGLGAALTRSLQSHIMVLRAGVEGDPHGMIDAEVVATGDVGSPGDGDANGIVKP